MMDEHYAPNDLFARAVDDYWVDIDRMEHEANHFCSTWPEPSNPFFSRLGKNLRQGYSIHNATLDCLRDLIAGALMHRENGYVRFLITPSKNEHTLSAVLTSFGRLDMPPICADNAGAYEIALNWALKRGSQFYLTCASNAEMWIDP